MRSRSSGAPPPPVSPPPPAVDVGTSASASNGGGNHHAVNGGMMNKRRSPTSVANGGSPGRRSVGRPPQSGRRRRPNAAAAALLLTTGLYLTWTTFVLFSFDLDVESGEGDANRARAAVGIHRRHHGLFRRRNGDGAHVESVPGVAGEADGSAAEAEVAAPPHQNNPSSSTLPNPDVVLRPWRFDRETALRVQSHFSRRTSGRRKSPILTAYLERPLVYNNNNDTTAPHQPLRTQDPSSLTRHEYPEAVPTCSKLQSTLPVNHPPSASLKDEYRNVNNKKNMYDTRVEYAKYCPVDADPYLPWMHDVFASSQPNDPSDEYFVEIVAQNKRRCNTGLPRFKPDLENLKPQVAIMQPVPVRRLKTGSDDPPPSELWRPPTGGPPGNPAEGEEEGVDVVIHAGPVHRYKLATSHSSADPDAVETRFLCRFHTYDVEVDDDDEQHNELQKVILGETLSTYPYNYEYANYRKGSFYPMLTEGGKGANANFWNSVQHHRCPLPPLVRDVVSSGASVVDDVPSIFLDVIPIRTRARGRDEEYVREELVGNDGDSPRSTFDPATEWGDDHVLPLAEASGRWANVPVCGPHRPVVSVASDQREGTKKSDGQPASNAGLDSTAAALTATETDGAPPLQQQHFTLIGCLWASATFATRGNAVADSSTPRRLLEWLTYHLYVANVDHVYVYDNTGAHVDDGMTSLKPVLDLFPRERVTRIDWPHRVCNNNIPAHSNTGERSSQYAAEASCRLRYGPHAEWLASFDTDEYLVPVEPWRDLRHWLTDGVNGREGGVNVLSFRSTKSSPNIEYMEPYDGDGDKCDPLNDDGDGTKAAVDVDVDPKKQCLVQRQNATFLETYNCDFAPHPKPSWSQRAKKQIYRPRYVLNHYVHYSTVTRGLVEPRAEFHKRGGKRWKRNYSEPRTSERFTDELTEAYMVHAKTTPPDDTAGYLETCRVGYQPANQYDKCRVGIPWPVDSETNYGENEKRLEELRVREGQGGGDEKNKQPKNGMEGNEDGLAYTCYKHERIAKELVPKLKEALVPLQERQRQKQEQS